MLNRCAIIFICLAVLSLQGCSVLTQPVAPHDVLTSARSKQVAWYQHRDKINKIKQWDIVGRAGVITSKNSGSVSLDWQQKQQHYTLTFSGPFGRVLAQLSGDIGGHSTLIMPGHSPIVDVSGERLVARATGWDIPFDALHYWVLGLPVPRESKTTDLQINAQGRLDHLSQLGWQVAYSRYVVVHQYILPSHLRLTGHGVIVTLVINWQSVNG